MNINSVYILKNRAVLYISGEDAKDYLQNLITNDIKKVSDENSCLGTLLSPQGKFLFEFIIIKHKSGFFIDCEKDQSEELFKQLSIYKLRSKIEILDLSNEFIVTAFSHEKFLTLDNAKDKEGYTLRYREDPILLDPRHKNLGARLIINLEKLYLSLKKLGLKNANIEEYYSHSHNLGIVPKNLNKLQNKLFGIECNYDELNGIDFKKGCYVGQENTARIKYKKKLRKRLCAINHNKNNLFVDDLIYCNDISVGKILIDGEYVFGVVDLNYLNLEYINNITCKNNKIKVLNQKWMKNSYYL
jgi:folate-binding protein YgfZ